MTREFVDIRKKSYWSLFTGIVGSYFMIGLFRTVPELKSEHLIGGTMVPALFSHRRAVYEKCSPGVLLIRTLSRQSTSSWKKRKVPNSMKSDRIFRCGRKFGSLYFKDSGILNCEPVFITGAPQDTITKIETRYCIGPITQREFWQRQRGDMQHHGPWTSSAGYLESIARREIDWIQSHADPEPVKTPWQYVNPEQHSPEAHTSLLQKFLTAVSLITPQDPELVSSRRWHPDFHAGNIYVDDQAQISCIIDWQGAWSTPVFLGANPPLLLDYGIEMLMELPDDFKSLDDATKDQLRYQVSQSILIHTYETLTAEQNPLMYKVMHHPHGQTLKQLEAFAGSSWKDGLFPLEECLIQQIQQHNKEVEMFNKSQEFWKGLQNVLTDEGYTSNESLSKAVEALKDLRATGLRELKGEEKRQVTGGNDTKSFAAATEKAQLRTKRIRTPPDASAVYMDREVLDRRGVACVALYSMQGYSTYIELPGARRSPDENSNMALQKTPLDTTYLDEVITKFLIFREGPHQQVCYREMNQERYITFLANDKIRVAFEEEEKRIQAQVLNKPTISDEQRRTFIQKHRTRLRQELLGNDSLCLAVMVAETTSTNLNKHTGVVLRPLLEEIQTRLPIELRKTMYEYLVDFTEPAMIKPEAGGTVQPFPPTFAFDADVMGPVVSVEIQDLYVQTASFRFRGDIPGAALDRFIDFRLPSGRYVRDTIQHLRVYTSFSEATEKAVGDTDNDEVAHTSYEALAAWLSPLHSIVRVDRKVKIELCVFTTLTSATLIKVWYNLTVAMQPIYTALKKAGAQISVRLENHDDGYIAEISSILEMDTEGPSAISAIRLALLSGLTIPLRSFKHDIKGPNIHMCTCSDCLVPLHVVNEWIEEGRRIGAAIQRNRAAARARTQRMRAETQLVLEEARQVREKMRRVREQMRLAKEEVGPGKEEMVHETKARAAEVATEVQAVEERMLAAEARMAALAEEMS
ncbi:hypothetical protein OPT61_g9014 [Boeremia exigua]|uniref:Uncharacterized protein n=1 Tax=Boeremia exigua TaxID=749465 RepID=A0ACC2HWF9_9PLEO|nr:hypothetical protein OPT61_g9014 [Boeremia exigua]